MSRLRKIIRRFPQARILVAGDLILDRYQFGRVKRISPEAPVPVMELEREEARAGGAGNAVLNLAALGARVFVAGPLGRDAGGRELAALLRNPQVDLSGVVGTARRVTPVKTRVVALPQYQQVVRVDRERSAPLSRRENAGILDRIAGKIGQVDAVIVSDYGKGTVTQEFWEGLFAEAGKRRIPVGVDPKPRNFALYRGADFLSPNNSEAGEIAGFPALRDREVERAGRDIIRRTGCRLLLITRGEKGMSLFAPAGAGIGVEHIPTAAREVFDVSGAGDTVIAVFTLALSAGADPGEAALLANAAAGLAVGRFGTAAVSPKELEEALETGRR